MKKRIAKLTQPNELSASLLNQLIVGDLLVVQMPGFLPADPCENLARAVDAIADYGTHQYSPKIGAVGQSLHASSQTEVQFAEYCRSASSWEAQLDFMADDAGLINPATATLDAVGRAWPPGVEREDASGHTLFAGATRSFQPGAAAPAHVDGFEVWLGQRGIDVPFPLKTQLAASVYLSASSGGELELWDWVPSHEELIEYGTGSPLELRRSDLTAPDATVAPRSGDLIIYNARKIHAMRATGPGLRAAVSMFLGFRRGCVPLTYWS